jgi:hypothetical protein
MKIDAGVIESIRKRKYNRDGDAFLTGVTNHLIKIYQEYANDYYDDWSNILMHQAEILAAESRYTFLLYYLKELGFSLSENFVYNGSSYIYSNEFGKGMIRINIFPNREYKGDSDIAGELSLYFNENTCTHIEYKNGEDAVTYINSLITTTCSINVGCFLNVMRALRGELNKMTNAKVSDVTNILDIKTKDYREEMIPILEKILEKLKEE